MTNKSSLCRHGRQRTKIDSGDKRCYKQYVRNLLLIAFHTKEWLSNLNKTKISSRKIQEAAVISITVVRAGTMTLRWLIVAQSPSAYTLSHPSTRNYSSVTKARLLACA